MLEFIEMRVGAGEAGRGILEGEAGGILGESKASWRKGGEDEEEIGG